jgi:predicted dehydrogenase
MKEIRVGIIGCGGFMGKAHSNAYRQVARFFDLKAEPVMQVGCGRSTASKKAAKKYGWLHYEKDWQKVIARDDVDVIDICTPGDLHVDMAIAAANAGKHIICEKPLANDLGEAKKMLAAAKKARIKTMVAFNYRRCPAIGLAKQMIDEGRLGMIYHVRAVYLQDWIMDPNFPLVWRLIGKRAGSGPHGDLNAHIVDLAQYLVGNISEVSGMAKTFIKRRPLESATGPGLTAKRAKKTGLVTVEDACLFLAKFTNGALGSFEATRFANGRKNHNQIEINGSKGSIVFDLERMNELQYFNSEDNEGVQGFRTILATEAVHPYMEAWWPPGHIIGWEHTFTHEVYDFLTAISSNKKAHPDFADGTVDQAVLEAVMKSVKTGRWVKVKSLL